MVNNATGNDGVMNYEVNERTKRPGHLVSIAVLL